MERSVESPSGLDELYREVILDHYKSPRNRGRLAEPDVVNRGHNPLCGDEVTVSMKIQGDRLADILFDGRGCSISQASASMMTESLKGATLDEAAGKVDAFKAMMHGSGGDPDAIGDVEALQGVRKYPVRVKCALLAWTTLQEGIDAYRKRSVER